MSKKFLRPIPFQDTATQTVTAIDLQRNTKASIHENLLEYNAIGNLNQYRSKIAILRIKGMMITAVSTTPTYVLRDLITSRDLVIPLTNHLTIKSQKSLLKITPRKECFFEGTGRQGMTAEYGSYVRIKCDLKSFHSNGVMLDLSENKNIQSKVIKIDKISSSEINYLLSILDRHANSPQFLEKICIDHFIFNLLRRLIGSTNNHFEKDYKDVRPEINLLCQYLIENIDQPISVYLMEKISGLSGKTIQNAFRKYYHCRPMEWVRNERLEKARIFIQKNPTSSLTDLAYDLGFCSASNFAKFYKLRFYELPSETQQKYQKL
jgi:AraC-like DNA-binding protein